MLDHASYLNRKYFSELDGVRALSVLLVFTVHLSAPFWHSLNGGTGVTVFFVLSGWLITTLALREEARNGRLNLKAFYTRRVFRIAPVYFAVLAAYVVMILVLGMQPERRAVFAETLPFYVLFFPEYSQLLPSVPFSGAWSLGIEEKFYFVWPLLGFVVLAWKFRARAVVLTVAAGLFALTAFLDPTGYVLPPYAFIALGCLAAVLLNERVWFDRLRFLGRGWVLAATAGVLAVLQFVIGNVTPGRPLYLVFGLVATLVLVGLVVTSSRGVGWLSARPLVFLGKISYAFYLTHNFAVNAVEKVLPGGGLIMSTLSVVAALSASVALAWVMHILIEKPSIKLGHRLTAKRIERKTASQHAHA